MKYFNPLLLLSLVLLASCGKSDQKESLSFKDVRTGRTEVCSQPFCFDTYKDLWVTDDCFIVVGFERHSETFLHVFDRATGAFRKNFVARGRSGDEVLSVGETYLSGKILHIWDSVGKALYKCDLSDAFNADVLSLTKVDLQDPGYMHVMGNGRHAVLMGNASFIENAPLNAKPRLLVEDLVSGEQADYNGYPLEDRYKTWWMYMQPTLAVNKDFQRMAVLSSCYYGCVMELFDISDEKITCLNTLTLVPPAFEGKANGTTPDEDLRYGAVDAVGSDHSIILAFDGNTKVSEEEAVPSFNNLLWFDWSGRPVRKTVIDRSLSCLTLSEEGDLYALVRNDDGDVMIVRIVENSRNK